SLRALKPTARRRCRVVRGAEKSAMEIRTLPFHDEDPARKQAGAGRDRLLQFVRQRLRLVASTSLLPCRVRSSQLAPSASRPEAASAAAQVPSQNHAHDPSASRALRVVDRGDATGWFDPGNQSSSGEPRSVWAPRAVREVGAQFPNQALYLIRRKPGRTEDRRFSTSPRPCPTERDWRARQRALSSSPRLAICVCR